MTNFETLSILISVVAAGIAVYSLIRTGKVQKQQMRLNQQTEEILKWKLEVISRQKEEQTKAYVEVSLVDEGTNWAIYLVNVGQVPASQVSIKLSDPAHTKNPFVGGDYEAKIPVSILNPGQDRRLLVASTHDTPRVFGVQVEWLDPGGSQQSYETELAF